MLIHFQAALLFIALLSCLVSAFSTRFLIEGVDEGEKTPAVEETKTQKLVKNDTSEKQVKNEGIEVEVIPIVTDMFTEAEDLFNMTPLKLVAAISAQHLLTTVQNIPVAGNSYEKTLEMLEGIVSEFNKTAQIIKLTAKYVNISGHYILSTLKEFAEHGCKEISLDEAMKSVRKNFLKTISDHAVGAIKELNEKTRQREMTGSDILISSSYHIVSAFQEMTNQVLTLAAESKKKCKFPSPNINVYPPSGEQNFISGQKSDHLFSFQPIPQQGKKHKSIKKDQAQTKTGEKATQTTFGKFQDQALENFNNHDLTVEVFSPETFSAANNAQSSNQKSGVNKLKAPEHLTVEHIPLKKISLFPNSNNGLQAEKPKQEHVNPKTSTINKFQDQTLDNFNNQDLTVEFFPAETILKSNHAQSSNQEAEANKLKVPEDWTVEYIPLKKMSLFQNSKSGMLSETPKEGHANQKTSTINKFGKFQDQTLENFNNQDLTVEVFPPENIFKSNNPQLSNQKGEINQLKVPEDLTVKYIPLKQIFQNSKSGILTEMPKEEHANQKTAGISKDIDRELDSSAVDSLSNIPWLSAESEARGFNKDSPLKATTKNLPSTKNVMNFFNLLESQYRKQQQQCDEHLEPVCGFDEKSKKFIIFLNDCKREAHNGMHQTNYSSVNMDSCVGLFLRSPAPGAKPFRSSEALLRNVDLRPR